MSAAVYAIRNMSNGRQYIGGTSDVDKRWSQHRLQLRAGLHANEALQRDWTEHGERMFVCIILESEPDDLRQAEQLWISTSNVAMIYNERRATEAPRVRAVPPTEITDARSAGQSLVSHRKRATFVCASCGREYEAWQYQHRDRETPRYCSTACRSRAWRQRTKEKPDEH